MNTMVCSVAGVCFLLLSVLTRAGEAQDVSVDISQSLLVLLSEETSLRAGLEQQLNELGSELNALQALENNVTCECAWHQSPVAFWATLSNDISSLGTKQQIRFDNVKTDIGGGYDQRHGEFRAPVSGTYEFTVAMLMNPAHWAGVEIVKDNVPIAKVRTGDANDWTMATAVAMVHLDAGQDVWVEHIAESDSALIYGQDISSFTGHLIQP